MTSSALKLGYRTQLDQQPSGDVQKSVVVRHYGDGIVEVGMSTVPSPNASDVDHSHKKSPQYSLLSQDEKDRVNLDRSMRRSKATVRRKSMTANLNYLLTLTYRENKTDLEDAWNDFRKFIRLVRKNLKDYPYVVVAERQKRGAVHFHLGVRGFQNVELLRKLWRHVVGPDNGNIQSSPPKLFTITKCAYYLTKYISKDLCLCASGRQRYRVSEGIKVPRHQAFVWFQAGSDWLGEVFDSLGEKIGFRYESEDGWAWACSW